MNQSITKGRPNGVSTVAVNACGRLPARMHVKLRARETFAVYLDTGSFNFEK